MSLDVAPDGNTLVFDLVGHLYTLPIQGGEAKQITSGLSYDSQPRFSPDGKHIVYVSDRSGATNLWIANADGSSPHALTNDENTGFVSPTWTADGRFIVSFRRSCEDRRTGPAWETRWSEPRRSAVRIRTTKITTVYDFLTMR